MIVFSAEQEKTYNSAIMLELKLLEKILKKLISSNSKENFFFIARVALTKNKEIVDQFANFFYEEPHQFIKKFLMNLNDSVMSHNNNPYIKSITDPKLKQKPRQP